MCVKELYEDPDKCEALCEVANHCFNNKMNRSGVWGRVLSMQKHMNISILHTR